MFWNIQIDVVCFVMCWCLCRTEMEVPEDSQKVETAVLIIGILVGFLGFVVGIILIVKSKMELPAVWFFTTFRLLLLCHKHHPQTVNHLFILIFNINKCNYLLNILVFYHTVFVCIAFSGVTVLTTLQKDVRTESDLLRITYIFFKHLHRYFSIMTTSTLT